MKLQQATTKRLVITWAILNKRLLGSFLYLEATEKSDIDIAVTAEELKHFQSFLKMECLTNDYGFDINIVTLGGVSYKTTGGGRVINFIEFGDFHAPRMSRIVRDIAMERGVLDYYQFDIPLEDRMSKHKRSEEEKKAMREIRVLHHALAQSVLQSRRFIVKETTMSSKDELSEKELAVYLDGIYATAKRKHIMLRVLSFILTASIGFAMAIFIAFAFNLYEGGSNDSWFANDNTIVTDDSCIAYKGVADDM